MDDGTPVLFTEEALRAAAETQTDEPLTADHPADDFGRPEYPPSTDDTYGKVTKARYLDGKGVGYEANVHDPDLARGIHAGSYEVSIHPSFRADHVDEESGLLVAEDIDFLDLSVVSKGDSPSNTVNWGPSEELAAWVHDNDIAAELTAAADDDNGGDAPTPPDADRPAARGLVDSFAEFLGVDTARGGAASAQTDDEPAESGPDPLTQMDDKYQTLINDHDFSEESLEAMDEDDLDRLYDSVTTTDGSGDPENSTQNTVEVDLGDHDSLEDYVADIADNQVAAAKAQTEKADRVDEIIAHSDDFSEEDREDLMASTESVLNSLHEQATASATARLPGATGRQQATAGAEDAGEYEDLVAQLNGHGDRGDD
ncbi:hypothetical protein J2752_000446 [Halarchaeum rubridurum]|nr:hypothetical protein [Halarchaeum rubridurum]MBP1953565.1 hypothetical protein [Halarchaeum rubridurum]